MPIFENLHFTGLAPGPYLSAAKGLNKWIDTLRTGSTHFGYSVPPEPLPTPGKRYCWIPGPTLDLTMSDLTSTIRYDFVSLWTPEVICLYLPNGTNRKLPSLIVLCRFVLQLTSKGRNPYSSRILCPTFCAQREFHKYLLNWTKWQCGMWSCQLVVRKPFGLWKWRKTKGKEMTKLT